MGRYAYNKQPEICKWNLGKFAEALEPELSLDVSKAILEEEYDAEFQRHYMQTMRKKLGLIKLEVEEDNKLISDLLETMNVTGKILPYWGTPNFITSARDLMGTMHTTWKIVPHKGKPNFFCIF